MAKLALWGVPAGLVGARIYSVMTSWQADTGGHWYRIFAIWQGGLGIWGGVVAGVAVGLFGARRMKLDWRAAIDCAAPALALAQGVGRWGNYFNQELYGTPSSLPWAVKIAHPVHCSTVTNCIPYPPGITTFQPTVPLRVPLGPGVCRPDPARSTSPEDQEGVPVLRLRLPLLRRPVLHRASENRRGPPLPWPPPQRLGEHPGLRGGNTDPRDPGFGPARPGPRRHATFPCRTDQRPVCRACQPLTSPDTAELGPGTRGNSGPRQPEVAGPHMDRPLPMSLASTQDGPRTSSTSRRPAMPAAFDAVDDGWR